VLYRGFTTQEQIDAEYDAAAAVDLEGSLARIRKLSTQALDRPAVELDLAYGPTRAERLHVLRATATPTPATTAGPSVPRPVFVFIHGGYWRAYAARDFALAALGPLAHGIDVVLVDYALAPTVSISEITRECRAAVAWVHGHATQWGGDPARIVVGGHSAGGHLTARVLATDWGGEYGLPVGVVAGGLALSGVFDLRPLAYSYLAPALQLDRRTIETESPLLMPIPPGPPRIVAWGGGETAEFVRQSQAYVAACRDAGIDARPLQLGRDDHFQAVIELSDPDSELTQAVVSLAAQG
jgi:arylformamidase